MQPSQNEPDRVNRRHLRGFRKFQQAALKALSVAAEALKDKEAENEKALLIKVGDLKNLVQTYKEAVAGERAVLGMEEDGISERPDELRVSWVDFDEEDARRDNVDVS
jgi:hypothetical protein